jgi:type II secretion system protein N
LAFQRKGKKALHAVIFILLGILLFILFLYIGFPCETLKRRIIRELEARSPFLYEIEEIHPHPLVGLTFKNMVAYASVGSKRVRVLGAERLRVTVSLLPLLWRTVSLRLQGRVLGGTLVGGISKRGDQRELTLRGKDMNLQQFGVLKDLVGMEMTGILRGKTVITLGGGDISQQSGRAEFLVTTAILSRLPLPGLVPLRIGRIEGKVELRRGSVLIKRLAFSEGDFEGQVLGNIVLSSHFPDSRLNLRITVEPAAEFDPRHLALLSLLGRKGKIKGSLAFSMRGTLGRPRLVTK